MPDAYVAALLNSYNAPVLVGNADLDEVFVYTKGKHAGNMADTAAARIAQARLLWHLRQLRFDDVVLAEPTYTPRNIRMAQFILSGPWLGGRRAGTRIGGFEHDDGVSAGLDVVASKAGMDGLHMAQIIMRLANAYGIATDPASTPACRVVPPAGPSRGGARALIGLHISARKPSQRWPVERFAALVERLGAQYDVGFRVLWSPGDEHNSLHPGDDQKAAAFERTLDAANGEKQPIEISFVTTTRLDQLIGALAEVDMMICADGGAMHLAAGLGKPVVALFGDSDPVRWRPWMVNNRVLQPASLDVSEIAVGEVLQAVRELIVECGFGAHFAQFEGIN